jgi:hypothetical protein
MPQDAYGTANDENAQDAQDGAPQAPRLAISGATRPPGNAATDRAPH